MLPGQSAVWGLLLYIQINILLSVEPALYDYIIHVLLCDRNRKQFPVWDIISAVKMCIRDRSIRVPSRSTAASLISCVISILSHTFHRQQRKQGIFLPSITETASPSRCAPIFS